MVEKFKNMGSNTMQIIGINSCNLGIIGNIMFQIADTTVVYN